MHRNLYPRASLESLERRRLLSLTVASALPSVAVPFGSSAASVDVSNTFISSDLTGDTIVQMQTTQGTMDFQLYDSQAPITVQNFLSYVNSGQYNNTLFYRAVAGFVDQTGVDYPLDADSSPITVNTSADTPVAQIQTDNNAPEIQNEYSPSRSNIEGTIAMAKHSGLVNSASTEWFINLADNSQNLNNQNGGFTVFGNVINTSANPGMTVAQTIGNLPIRKDYGDTGSDAYLPVVNYNYGNVEAGNLVLVPSVSVIPAITYTVASSNTAIVNPTLNGTNLALTYGQPGTTTVTVTATDVEGNITTNTFNVTVEVPQITVSENGTTLTNAQSAPVAFGLTAPNGLATQTFTITNNGDEALLLNQISVPAGFQIVGTAPTSIAAGASADLTLVADTSTIANFAGNLSIATNDPSNATFTVPLSATIAPRIAVQDNGAAIASGQSIPIDFGIIAVGGTSQQTFTITNTGDTTLGLTQFTLPTGYNFVGDTPTTIAAGASANITVAIDSGSTGAKSGALDITSNDPSQLSFAIPLTGDVDFSATVGSVNSTKAKSFTYIDGDGTLTTITLKGPGTLTPFFSSTSLITQTAGKSATSFAGTAMLLQNLEIDSTTAKSSLTITSKGGDGITVIQNLNDATALNAITAKRLDLTGSVSLISAKSLAIYEASEADITAQSLGDFSLTANSTFALQLSGALTTLTAKGAINNSTITASSIKTISAASMTGDKIETGSTLSAFPPAGSDVSAGSSMSSVKVKGIFANTDIVAGSLGAISLGAITTDNAGTSFGLATDMLKSFSAHAGGKPLKLSKITASNAGTLIAALGNLGDFQIDIL